MSSSVTVSAVSDTVTPAALGVAIASSEYGPSLAPVRVALTRTVYAVSLARPGSVWLVVEPEATVAWRSLVL